MSTCIFMQVSDWACSYLFLVRKMLMKKTTIPHFFNLIVPKLTCAQCFVWMVHIIYITNHAPCIMCILIHVLPTTAGLISSTVWSWASWFFTHVLVSFVAYLFAWFAWALQSKKLVIPMLLSTTISFGWYAMSAEWHHHSWCVPHWQFKSWLQCKT